jgi:phospholipase/carboxylesterase
MGCLRLAIPILLTVTAFAASLAGAEIRADFSEPESIDIYRSDAGSFLDTDLRELATRAFNAYNAQQYELAAKYYLALLRRDITNTGSIYNLACCYGLLGRDTLAASYLAKAVRAGFEDLEHAKEDPDFDRVRDKEIFASLMDSVAVEFKKKKEASGTEIYVRSPAYFKCYVHLPEDYEATRAYPLLVGLHGYGGNPERFMTLWERFSGHQFIFASPQAPYAFFPGRELGYSWNLPQVGEDALLNVEEYVKTVVAELKRQHKVSNTYIFGFSQGCATTYFVGIRNPKLFKGLVCFGGWLDEELLNEETLEDGKRLRVFMAHATDDRVVPYEAAIRARELLENHGYDVTFCGFRGGHSTPEAQLEEAEKWMMK